MGCFKAVCRSEGKVLEQASSYSRTVPVVVVGLLQALAKQDQARPKEKKKPSKLVKANCTVLYYNAQRTALQSLLALVGTWLVARRYVADARPRSMV